MFQVKEDLQEERSNYSKKPDNQIQEYYFMENQLPGFIEKDIRYTRVVQAKKYSPEEIIELAAEEGLVLNQMKNGHFIRLLTSLDSSGLRWLFRRKPEAQVQTLLKLAKRYGSAITEAAWEENEEELLYYLDGNTSLNAADQWNTGKRLTMEELQEKLNDEQKKLMLDHLRILYPICGKEGTSKALEGAMLYVNTSYFDSLMGEQPRYFVQCLGRTARFIKTVYDGLDEEYKKDYWLESTGSDRHMNGGHVLFLVSKKNKNDKKVLKPRSLDIDDAVVGENGMFHIINEEIDDESKPRLVTMHMESHRGRPGEFQYGIQDYQEKKTMYSVDEAKKYYYQMGMLEIASRYLGMTDLHQDNIMPTERGPLIIDAEVGLFFSETGLRDALIQNYNQLMQPALAKITIAGGLTYAENAENEFHQEFQYGKIYMERKMRELCQKPEFVEQLFDKTKNICVRIVPVATNHLAIWYRASVAEKFNYSAFKRYMKMEPAGELGGKIRIDYICESLEHAISKQAEDDRTPYFKREGEPCSFNKNVIIKQVLFSMKKHDVPLFELVLHEGRDMRILLNKKEIGTTKVEFRHKDILPRRISMGQRKH